MPPSGLDQYQRRVGTVLLAGPILLMVGLGGRLAHINTMMATRLADRIERQHTGFTPIPARRGSIFDVRGRLLAGSEEVSSVFADPLLIDDRPGSAVCVGAALDMIPGQVEDIIRQSPSARFCWIKRRVPSDQAMAVRGLELGGIGLIDESTRRYPLRTRLAHVLGFVGADDVGLSGIELQWDHHLRGRDGRIRSVRDVGRRAIWRMNDGTVPVEDGGHVTLTIDAVIQSRVEEMLSAQVEAFEAESGVALVMSPDTGDVLAMACCPTFDPGDYATSPAGIRRNRAIVDPVEPGSTLKPIIAGAALAAGLANTQETIFCHQGAYPLPGRVIRDTHPHGDLDFKGIIVQSSNIGMAIMGQRLGNAGLREIVQRFGLGERTGIELPGESAGIVRALSHWTTLTTTSIPMGYEIGVTPLQLATAYCAIVNGGVLLKPRLVRGLLAPDGEPLVWSEGPEPVRRVLPAATARFLTEDVLPAVANRDGPVSSAYPILGKTGTTKLTRPGTRGYVPGEYLSSFIGAAPVEDPAIVVLVMITRPAVRKGYFGRQVSLPVARDIIESTLAYLEAQSGTLSR